MANINQALLNIEDSVFGTALFGQDVFLNEPGTPIRDGIYYTKIFQKSDIDFWHRVAWLDNQVKGGVNDTSGKMKVEIRTRTGNVLPIKDYTTGTRYTLDEINSIIETQPIDVVDSILERATLNRSVLSNISASGVTSTNVNYERLGTSYNSFRINSTDDTIWNYWSLPIINTPSFIPDNRDYNYLQARIWLQSNDNVTVPQVFRINFTSILKSSFTSSLTK